MATRSDVINFALRRIGVLAADELADADQVAYCGTILDGIFAELSAVHGITFTWALSAVPAGMLAPLANYLATEIAPHFDIPAPEPRARAIGRIRAYMLPDDRTDRADTDEDGAISEAEAAAAARAAFF